MMTEEEIDAAVAQNDTLRRARLGMDVSAGLGNPVTRLLIEKADERKQAAIDVLIWETDPFKVHLARLDAQGACLIGAWIAEAIEGGYKAAIDLEADDGLPGDEAAGVEGHDDQDEAGDA